MQIVLKEVRESSYWLRLIKRADLAGDKMIDLESIIGEAQELTKIIAKAVVSTKSRPNV